METPWGPLGYITYKRTYARKLKGNDSTTEEFTDTIDRILEACSKQLNLNFTNQEEQELKEILLSLKGIVAGRFLWQLGTKTVDKLGLASLQNCAGVVVDDPIRPFTWTMDMLMLGAGVGYNIQKEHVYELPKVKKVKITRKDSNDADFIVPDSRSGWTQLLEKTLKSHFYTGKSFTYSTVCIRSKGAPITGFGGTASGPDVLCWGIENISKILNSRAGKKLRPIDCLDIMNIIGFIVVSGNVRRSAALALGDADDLQYLNAKRWDLGNIPNWRAMSNNSIVCNDINLLPEQFWQGYEGNGEPYGLINLKLAQSIGRVGETQYPDKEVITFNPCQPGFAKVTFANGKESTFDELKIGDVLLNKYNKETKVINKWYTGDKNVYCYTFKESNAIFIGTENHKVVSDKNKVEIEHAFKHKDNIKILTVDGWTYVDQKIYLGNYPVYDITVEDETHTYLTNGVYVSNCSEQSLENYETCCLAEVFLPNIASKEELKKVVTYLYKINKHSLNLDCHHIETNDVVHKNMRMGIGVTGYLQATIEQRSWLRDTYQYLRDFDKKYSKEHNWPESIKLTTVKPSGTLSLLAGVTPGVHPAYAKYYIRRIRIASNSELANICRKHGYYSEYQKNFDGTEDKNTVVVSFPCTVPDGTVLAKDLTAIQQLEYVKELQSNWSDNGVSVTVYYKKEELEEIKTWLKSNYNNNIKAVSFLLHIEHGFQQAPYQEITKEEYEEYVKLVSPITEVSVEDTDMLDSFECVGGYCPIK